MNRNTAATRVLVRQRIVSRPSPRMTTHDTTNGEQGTSKGTVAIERLECIFRTCRGKTAARPEHRRDGIAIKEDEHPQRPDERGPPLQQHSFRRPVSSVCVIWSKGHDRIGPRAISTKSVPRAARHRMTRRGMTRRAASRMRRFARLRATALPRRLVAVKPTPISSPGTPPAPPCPAGPRRSTHCRTRGLPTNLRPRAARRNSGRLRSRTSRTGASDLS